MVLQKSASWFVWNANIVDDILISLLVILFFNKFHIHKDFSFCLCLSNFSPESSVFLIHFPFAAALLKRLSVQAILQILVFPLSLALIDLELAALFDFELLFEDLREWHIVLDETFEHLLSTTFPQKPGIQSFPLILDLMQIVLDSFWLCLLRYFCSTKTSLAFLNFTVLSNGSISSWWVTPGRFDVHL